MSDVLFGLGSLLLVGWLGVFVCLLSFGLGFGFDTGFLCITPTVLELAL